MMAQEYEAISYTSRTLDAIDGTMPPPWKNTCSTDPRKIHTLHYEETGKGSHHLQVSGTLDNRRRNQNRNQEQNLSARIIQLSIKIKEFNNIIDHRLRKTLQTSITVSDCLSRATQPDTNDEKTHIMCMTNFLVYNHDRNTDKETWKYP